MYKPLLVYVFLFTFGISSAQIEGGLLLGLTNATTLEINGLTGLQEGQMLYNTDTDQIMVFDGTQWTSTANANWLNNGNVLGTGDYLGSNNDAIMDLRSNATSVLQFGRRQTLGLVQSYPDYTDNNQYMTYLSGANGTSALQFQADAASFYKPMFFTTPQGNFRLKGSAAGTDFFEIGSTGVSNNGEVEFIIADDGAEPFIFKRYDYRDQLLKELFRVQGASDSQNALPRVGINTGQVANSTLQVNGSVSTAINTTSANLTLDETHHTIIVTNNSSITLPAANSCNGRSYIIKNQTTSPINISTYLDNGGTNATSINANNTLEIQSNGTVWHAITTTAAATNMKFFETVHGRAYFYNNIWYAPNDQYSIANQNWSQNKGSGGLPNYSNANQAGIPIPSDVVLNKFVMKNDFNANPTGSQQINLSVLRGGTILNIGTYTLTGLSTNVSIQNQTVNFQLLENDLLVWACTTVGGINRLSYMSISFEFGY